MLTLIDGEQVGWFDAWKMNPTPCPVVNAQNKKPKPVACNLSNQLLATSSSRPEHGSLRSQKRVMRIPLIDYPLENTRSLLWVLLRLLMHFPVSFPPTAWRGEAGCESGRKGCYRFFSERKLNICHVCWESQSNSFWHNLNSKNHQQRLVHD